MSDRPAGQSEGEKMMGGDLIPRAIEMAREIRRGEADHDPSALHRASLGRADIYRHAMREAGYVVSTATWRAPAICDVCRYDFGKDAPARLPVLDGWAIPDDQLTPDELRAVRWVRGERDA